MAPIASRLMMTAQVERVIAAEIAQDVGSDADVLLGVARAPAYRAGNVVIRCRDGQVRTSRERVRPPKRGT